MKKLTIALFTCLSLSAFAEDYTPEEQAEIDERYQAALEEWNANKDTAKALRTLGQFFTDDEKIVAALMAHYQEGDARAWRKLNNYSNEMTKYTDKLEIGSVYGYCRDLQMYSFMLLNGWDQVAKYGDARSEQQVTQARESYDKAYRGCKEEINYEPKREDFRPLAVI